jgi:hypothetical protein
MFLATRHILERVKHERDQLHDIERSLLNVASYMVVRHFDVQMSHEVEEEVTQVVLRGVQAVPRHNAEVVEFRFS